MHLPSPRALLVRTDQLLLLKLVSLCTGAFLVFAGLTGACSIWLGGGFVYFIGSLYTVFFGSVVLVLEVKDKSRPVSAAYGWLSTYLKFVTFQALFTLSLAVLCLPLHCRIPIPEPDAAHL